MAPRRISLARRLLCARSSPLLAFLLIAPVLALSGCEDDTEKIREIQATRQARAQTESRQDHLGDMYGLLERIIELNPEKARQQIVYHLNQWNEGDGAKTSESPSSPPAVLKTLEGMVPIDQFTEIIQRPTFAPSDVNHLRNAYLFQQIVRWVDQPTLDDPILAGWFQDLETKLGADMVARLRTATRLFDWTVRNVGLEPDQLTPPNLPLPPFPLGMTFEGAGYRQNDFQTVFRGTGDRFQRAGVFTQLCRQAGIPAAVLATQSTDTGELRPWSVGTLIGEEIYLYEPGLGIFVPGPDQTGIATLTEARRDPTVMRRLTVQGFDDRFRYPISREAIQQCVALLNVLPETISPRMKRLEEGLTGDRRMVLFLDADATAKAFDDAAGISGVRWWNMPILAEVYRGVLESAAERDPLLAFWYYSRWAIVDGEFDTAKSLSRGRWRHLKGWFEDDEEENEAGARTLYLQQRAPEFEIADLRINVDLQIQYGIRRDLGVSSEVYDDQLRQAQALMRLGKRTATYWLSLLQYDDARYETAGNWLDKRVLVESQMSFWHPAARYNLARVYEQLGKTEEAVELYKTDQDPQEHGNRLRARLISRGEEEPEVAKSSEAES